MALFQHWTKTFLFVIFIDTYVLHIKCKCMCFVRVDQLLHQLYNSDYVFWWKSQMYFEDAKVFLCSTFLQRFIWIYVSPLVPRSCRRYRSTQVILCYCIVLRDVKCKDTRWPTRKHAYAFLSQTMRPNGNRVKVERRQLQNSQNNLSIAVVWACMLLSLCVHIWYFTEVQTVRQQHEGSCQAVCKVAWMWRLNSLNAVWKL